MECTYKEFMNSKPNPFFGNEEVVQLTCQIKKMESVFQIHFYVEDCKVRFAACTFADATLSWWKNHAKTMGSSIVNAISWDELKKLLIDEYCPSEETQKLDQELQNLTMQYEDIASYPNHFIDLGIFYPNLFTPEFKKKKKVYMGFKSAYSRIGHYIEANYIRQCQQVGL